MAISEQELKDVIRAKCADKGRATVAELLGVKPQYVSMLLSKTSPRAIPAKIAERLGYKMHVAQTKVFEAIDK